MKRVTVTALTTLAFMLFAASSSFAGPIVPVPEPTSLILLGTGVAGIWVFRKLRK
jgi:hypothetical protein